MKNFKFTLVYKVPENKLSPYDLLSKLENVGCDEAFSGVDDEEKISLGFSIEASSLSQAVNTARVEVSETVPKAQFKEFVVDEAIEE